MPVLIKTVLRLLPFAALFLFLTDSIKAQCATQLNVFPYTESFETDNGGWFNGGTASDWTWGSPNKVTITAAGDGSRCWITGGLSGNSYNDSEASWLQSPCFDFTNLQHPYISFKVFWETEKRFDGAALQFSLDEGSTWEDVGSFSESANCLNENWYNYSNINYLASLSTSRNGWSGNIQPTSGSCQGGDGSGGWRTAKHVLPNLAGEPSVIFRFVFGAGSICNDYDGFAIDSISITEAPENEASFDAECLPDRTIQFRSTSQLCPKTFAWDFGDPLTGSENYSQEKEPTHQFSAPGIFNVTLTVSGEGNAPSTITREITVLEITTTLVEPADCITNNGGSAIASVSGGNGPFDFSWNTTPRQTTATATNLAAGSFLVTVTAAGNCVLQADITVPTDPSCAGIHFPSAFTPNGDGLNDFFGPIGGIGTITNFYLSVFNRWGERVFSATDPSRKWDGRYKGVAASPDIFVWRAQYSLPGNENLQVKGTILLIR